MSEVNNWRSEIDFPLVGREEKPRDRGLTMILDKGLGLQETRDKLDLAADYIDFWKLSFGTSFLYPRKLLIRKINEITNYGLEVYPGGTFLEVAVEQDKVEEYLQTAKELGFTAVEISDGTIEIPLDYREEIIKYADKLGFKVVTEIGKKDKQKEFKVDKMSRELKRDLAAGAYKVIVEARESGKGVSIYDESGQADESRLKKLLMEIDNPYNIIWEAPLKKQQVYFIKTFGNNVNLGNINPEEILALESLRKGLRGDTFKTTLNKKIDESEDVFIELDL